MKTEITVCDSLLLTLPCASLRRVALSHFHTPTIWPLPRISICPSFSSYLHVLLRPSWEQGLSLSVVSPGLAQRLAYSWQSKSYCINRNCHPNSYHGQSTYCVPWAVHSHYPGGFPRPAGPIQSLPRSPSSTSPYFTPLNRAYCLIVSPPPEWKLQRTVILSTWLLAHRKQINKFKHPTSLGGGVDLHTVGLSECVLKSVFRFRDKCVDYFMVRDELCQVGECSKNKSWVVGDFSGRRNKSSRDLKIRRYEENYRNKKLFMLVGA